MMQLNQGSAPGPTNAILALEALNIPYQLQEYDVNSGVQQLRNEIEC